VTSYKEFISLYSYSLEAGNLGGRAAEQSLQAAQEVEIVSSCKIETCKS
jgi:hypothetical protein